MLTRESMLAIILSLTSEIPARSLNSVFSGVICSCAIGMFMSRREYPTRKNPSLSHTVLHTLMSPSHKVLHTLMLIHSNGHIHIEALLCLFVYTVMSFIATLL